MKKTILRKTASSVLAFMMTFSSAGAVTAVSFSNVSAMTVKKASKKTTKRHAKKSKKRSSKKKVKKPSVYMTPLSKTLYVKSSAYIYLKNSKSSVKWSSSNAKVSLSKKTRSSVKVYAKSAGVSYVTARIGKKKYTCKVTVKTKSGSNEGSLKRFDKRNKIFMTYDLAGHESILDFDHDLPSLSISDNQYVYHKITYKSSDPNVVKPDHKTVSGYYDYQNYLVPMGTGTATVTATSGKQKFTWNVTVKPSKVYYVAKDLISSYVKPGMSDYEKAMAIAIGINKMAKYGDKYDNYQTAHPLENILLYKSGICTDYARTYAYLLKMAGMESRILLIESWDHEITQVKIDGKWYNADATDVPNPLNYPNLIKGSDQLNRLSDSDGITCCNNYDDSDYEGTKYHIGDAYDTKYDNYNYCKQACEEMMKKYFKNIAENSPVLVREMNRLFSSF